MSTNATAAATTSSFVNSSPLPGFTVEQLNIILSLIDDKKDGNEKLVGKVEWLYDTEASCHMIGFFELLKNVKDIEPIIMGLLDGNNTIAGKAGYVKLGPNVLLKRVLFVPKLKCNLISIWQLNKELNCIVTFNDNFYGVQECISRKLIGVDKIKGGVFLYNEVTNT